LTFRDVPGGHLDVQPIKDRVSIFEPGSDHAARPAAAFRPPRWGADSGADRRPRTTWSPTMGMPLWLILIVVGIVLALVGFGGAGNLLIWLGVIILVIGVVMTLLNRSGTRV